MGWESQSWEMPDEPGPTVITIMCTCHKWAWSQRYAAPNSTWESGLGDGPPLPESSLQTWRDIMYRHEKVIDVTGWTKEDLDSSIVR